MKVPWAIDPVHIYVIRDKTRLSGESVETQLSKYRRFISCCLDELCWNSSMVSDKSLSEHVLLPHSLDNCLLISDSMTKGLMKWRLTISAALMSGFIAHRPNPWINKSTQVWAGILLIVTQSFNTIVGVNIVDSDISV